MEHRIQNIEWNTEHGTRNTHRSAFRVPCSAQQGFSLLELLIVMAILVTMATMGSGMYRSFGKNVELSSAAQEIAADLRHMQSKAMTGEGNFKWGGHFVNGTPDDYYVLFSTSGTSYVDSGTVSIATTTLSKTISFSDPTDSASKDIIFNKISGTTTAATISVASEGLTQTVNISSVGTIY
ncbi:MAG: prepilin-type N-terminal cleavage/methylation domain-containing protein [Candidatus Yonathbacteria bacterium]|nr:prepilin-type N-terminal cleavage/methylation domain-containing protein [Candidatus Yonathbacteria bacterium]